MCQENVYIGFFSLLKWESKLPKSKMQLSYLNLNLTDLEMHVSDSWQMGLKCKLYSCLKKIIKVYWN